MASGSIVCSQQLSFSLPSSYLCVNPLSVLHTFSTANFHTICDQLGATDQELKFIIATYGYPPIRRADIFPIGDLAAVNALKQVKQLPKDTGREQLLEIAFKWQPHRTVATMILWHYYLSLRVKDTSAETQKIKKAARL